MTTEQPFAHVTYTDGDGREWSLWRRHNAGIDDSPERARWLMYPVPASLMAKFGYVPAPPSPPVAPEPAQESQASSGEAAGDGVTHQQAAVALQAIAERPGSEKTQERLELLELYRQQQERFDRDMGHPHERAVAAVARAQQAESDRDAERAQKEAALLQLEEANRKLILFSSRASSLLNHLSNEPDSDGAKNAWERLQSLVEGEFPGPPPELGQQEATFEPAPAAPVAKEEATAEDDCPTCGKGRPVPPSWCFDEWHNSEPAPQPPATTGEPLLGPVDALRAEIVAALRATAERSEGHTVRLAFTRLADELERRKP